MNKKTGWEITGIISLVVLALFIYVLLYAWMPRFVSLYARFGNDLPGLSSLFTGYYNVIYPTLILISIGSGLRVYFARGAMKWGFLVVMTVILPGFIFGLTILAMYLPIFSMGSVV